MLGFKGEKWEVFRLIPIFAALFLQEYIPEKIAAATGTPPNSLWSYAIPLVTAFVIVIAFALFDAFVRAQTRYAIPLYSELRQFEGLWAQTVGKQPRPYSISLVKFLPERGCWSFSGVGYESDFRPGSDWHATSIALERTNGDRLWFFAGRAHLRVWDEQLQATRRTISGEVIPWLYLPADPTKNVSGTVADIHDGGVRELFDVTLHRVPERVWDGLSSVDAILGLDQQEVKDILSESGIQL